MDTSRVQNLGGDAVVGTAAMYHEISGFNHSLEVLLLNLKLN